MNLPKALVDSAPFGILVVDPRGHVATINTKLKAILGLNPEDGFPAEDVFTFTPLVDSGIVDDIRRCLEDGNPACIERRLRTPGSAMVHLRCHLMPIVDDLHGNCGVQVILEDISDLKRIEHQVRQARKLEALGILAGGIAHDFNNILWIILGNAELAAAEIPPGHDARYNLEQVESACRRAQELVMQILRFSRQAEQERRPLKLGTIVHESLRLLRESIPSNIEVHHHLSTTADTILADITRINQLLMHLVSNAAHAMRNTGGILEVSIVDVILGDEEVLQHRNLVPGDYVILTVMDTGPGISPEILDRIFDPFFSTKSAGDHSGMGLTIVNSIVNAHGGTLTVQSEPGKGAIFHIILPTIGTGPEIATGPDRREDPVEGSRHPLVGEDDAADPERENRC